MLVLVMVLLNVAVADTLPNNTPHMPLQQPIQQPLTAEAEKCTGGRRIPHSNRNASTNQCNGADGDACAFKCDPGFWPVGTHVCQTYAVDGKVVINNTFFGGQ